MTKDRLVDIAKAAEILGVSVRTARRWTAHLDRVRIYPKKGVRRFRWRLSDIRKVKATKLSIQ